MTKVEYARCEKLMEEAIRKAKDSQKDFAYALKEDDQTKRKILSERGQNHLGYAEGINQTLVCIGFKHERMKKTRKSIIERTVGENDKRTVRRIFRKNIGKYRLHF